MRVKFLDYSELVVDGDMSGDVTSSATTLTGLNSVAYHCVWTGVPVGDLELQVSNDGSNWADAGVTHVATGGATGNAMVEHTTAAKYSRIFFDSTSGTGTLQVHVTGKSI